MTQRITRGVASLVAAGALLAIGGGTPVLAATHKNAPLVSCAMSPATAGSTLTVTGSGYTPGGKYAVAMTWPYGGTGDLLTTADSSGNLSVSTWAYWSGTYSARVLDSRGNTMASCSETVS